MVLSKLKDRHDMILFHGENYEKRKFSAHVTQPISVKILSLQQCQQC